ncbi:MAG: hypothetical protein GC200_07875 [Tepidisphaera sp.]|nr:hypothetical protein [Tepidisphaera sp.]
MLKQHIGFGLALCVFASGAWAQSFVPGDAYLISTSLPRAVNGSEPGIVKISPSNNWAVTRIYTGSEVSFGRATFDPFRGKIVVGAGSTSTLTFIDAAGTLTHLNIPRLGIAGNDVANRAAAAADGRIYFVRGATNTLAVLDGAGVVHEVLNQAGTAPEAVSNNTLTASYFSIATNTLIFAGTSGSNDTFERITFTPNGFQVVDRTSISTPMLPSAEIVTGMSEGPNGTVFVKSDDNSNDTLRRMRLLDPATMTLSVFASSGYFGVAGEVAGAYVPVAGKSLVLDTLSDQLRTFTPGAAGAGTIVATSGVSSGGGSGELAQIIVVPDLAPPCDPDVNQDGVADQGDVDYLVNVVAGGANPTGIDPDFNQDGVSDQGDIDALINVIAGGQCP